jgi:hypothetical protein
MGAIPDEKDKTNTTKTYQTERQQHKKQHEKQCKEITKPYKTGYDQHTSPFSTACRLSRFREEKIKTKKFLLECKHIYLSC